MIRGRTPALFRFNLSKHRSREETEMETSKTVMLSFRVSAGDEQMIREAAMEAGLSVSDWIRARIVGRL